MRPSQAPAMARRWYSRAFEAAHGTDVDLAVAAWAVLGQFGGGDGELHGDLGGHVAFGDAHGNQGARHNRRPILATGRDLGEHDGLVVEEASDGRDAPALLD